MLFDEIVHNIFQFFFEYIAEHDAQILTELTVRFQFSKSRHILTELLVS